jgi:hypothetical protein
MTLDFDGAFWKAWPTRARLRHTIRQWPESIK